MQCGLCLDGDPAGTWSHRWSSSVSRSKLHRMQLGLGTPSDTRMDGCSLPGPWSHNPSEENTLKRCPPGWKPLREGQSHSNIPHQPPHNTLSTIYFLPACIFKGYVPYVLHAYMLEKVITYAGSCLFSAKIQKNTQKYDFLDKLMWQMKRRQNMELRNLLRKFGKILRN